MRKDKKVVARPSADRDIRAKAGQKKPRRRGDRRPALERSRAAHDLLVDQGRLRAFEVLTFGIAHDVNNVLAALRLRVGILLKDSTCRAAQGSNLEAMDRILREGGALVGKLQNLGRSAEPKIGPVDLGETILAAVEIAQSGLRLRAAETGVQIRIRCDLPPLPKVRGYPEELKHVFVNLLVNARDAMPTGGTVHIRGGLDGRTVVVRVEDEGVGIPPAHLARIFDAFFTTKGKQGTGIGLAMAKNVLGRIGGAITAGNRAQGGACFELRFCPTDARLDEVVAPRGPGQDELVAPGRIGLALRRRARDRSAHA